MRGSMLYTLSYITIVIMATGADLSARNVSSSLHVNKDHNEVDSLPRDTLTGISITKDSVEAEPRAESIVDAPNNDTENTKSGEITSLSDKAVKVGTIATKTELAEKAKLTLPIPPGTFHDTKFTYVDDDEVLAMIDSLINELYEVNSCLDTGAARRNTYDFCDDLIPLYSKTEYATRLDYLDQQTPFSLTYNTPVHKFIELYALRRRDQVSRMLGLAEMYFPLFEEILDKYDMPLELKYLAVVESALNPSAGSRAGAKGLWQFMYRTGKMYGLNVTSYIDDRFDPYKSTVAACEYLQFLHGIYDDWDLALAAYNCGPGRVNRAIRRSGGKKDYWELWRYLPRETRGYVPAFIAVNYIMEYATEHNIYPTPPRYLDFEKDTVVVRNMVKFEYIEAVINVPKVELEYLNPQYKLGIIPGIPGETYALTLPALSVGAFINNELAIYGYKTEQERIDSAEKAIAMDKQKQYMQETRLTHTVKNGEVLGLIAEKYRVNISDVRNWNNLSSSRIYIGQKLTIYTGNKPSMASQPVVAKSTTKKQEINDLKFRYHVIRSGDTLWDIAKLYEGVTINQIKELNQINNARKLKPGMKIKISPASS
jgi:membrane-bound lytic murein transglycosylase D